MEQGTVQVRKQEEETFLFFNRNSQAFIYVYSNPSLWKIDPESDLRAGSHGEVSNIQEESSTDKSWQALLERNYPDKARRGVDFVLVMGVTAFSSLKNF